MVSNSISKIKPNDERRTKGVGIMKELPAAYLKPEALLELIRASVETFKKECVGFVCGKPPTKNHNRFLVTHVGAFQCVTHRRNNEIGESTGKKRMEQLFANAPHVFNTLGFFHSHAPQGDQKPEASFSKYDREDMIRNQTQLELLVAISFRKKRNVKKRLWQSLPDGDIGGSLGKYDFEIAAYTLVSDDEGLHPEKIKILAPEAIRSMNRALNCASR